MSPFSEIISLFKNFLKEMNTDDKVIEDLLKEYENRYIQIGWDVFTCTFIVIYISMFVILHIVAEDDSFIKRRSKIMAPLYLVILVSSRFTMKKFPKAKKYMISIFIVILGLANTNGNLSLGEYRVYEMWLIYL